MTTISAKAILVSRHAQTNHKLATVLCRYPRWIHAEGRTHRQLRLGEPEIYEEFRTPSLMEDPHLSRNAASSRAIPVKKLIEDVLRDPAIPLFWGKNQRGMQATEECNEIVMAPDLQGNRFRLTNEEAWLMAMKSAVRYAKAFDKAGYHKQIVNRLLEPFSHITVLISATEWTNFFALRIHPDAEPHIQLLAKKIKEAIDTAPVQVLQPGEWHLPFVSVSKAEHVLDRVVGGELGSAECYEALNLHIKLSVARCASTSYKTVDGFDMTLDRAVQLHDRLVSSQPIHASPAEHVAKADTVDPSGGWRYPEQHRNFRGFRQYRAMIPGDTAT